MEPLRVNPVGLRQAAGSIAAVGSQLTGSQPAPPTTGESWQSSIAVAATAHAGAGADETALTDRMRATATKVGMAATTYTRTDTTTASTLTTQVV